VGSAVSTRPPAIKSIKVIFFMANSPAFYYSKVNAKPAPDPRGEDLLSMQSLGGFLS
jgi:hypothetical protein